MPKKDLNQIAFDVVRRATEEVAPDPLAEKKQAISAIRRKSGIKGGVVRAQNLTAQKRKAIAKKAAKTRWKVEVEDN